MGEKAKEILELKSTGSNFAKTTRCFVMPRLVQRVAAVTGIRGKLGRHHLTAKVDVGAILALIFAPTSLINSWQRAKEKAKDMEKEREKAPISLIKYNRKLNTTHSNSANLQD